MGIGRFRQLKERERRKKLSKALQDENVQNLDSASGSEEESDEESNDKVRSKIDAS